MGMCAIMKGTVSTELDFSRIRSEDGGLLGFVAQLPIVEYYQTEIQFYTEIMDDPDVAVAERIKAAKLRGERIEKLFQLAGLTRTIRAHQERQLPDGTIQQISVQAMDTAPENARKVRDTLALLQEDAAKRKEEKTFEPRIQFESTGGGAVAVDPAGGADDEFDRPEQGPVDPQPPIYKGGKDHQGRESEETVEIKKEPGLYRPRSSGQIGSPNQQTDGRLDYGHRGQARTSGGTFEPFVEPDPEFKYRKL